MSSIQTTLSIKINDKRQVDVLFALLNHYNYTKSKSNEFVQEVKLLRTIGLDGTKIFNESTPDISIYDITKSKYNIIGFTFEGGTISTPEFQKKLIDLLRDAKTSEIIVLAFHDQVGEYEIEIHANDKITRYSTGMDGEADDAIYEKGDSEDIIDIVRELFKNGQLVMPKNDDNDDILDDPFMYKLAYPIAALSGIVFFGIPVFFVCWLVYFTLKTALIIGATAALINTLYLWLGLYGHKINEEEELTQLILDDAKDLGVEINKDQAKNLMTNFENALKSNGIK